ncbi:MAG: hypothetical protein IKG18_07615 [Atopobiaceae bacterium]|nr:hypothetical protein [Atopobiaceae bacterium]
MQPEKLFSSYQLQDISLLSLQLDVSEYAPIGEQSITVTVNTDDTSYDTHEDSITSITKMSVSASLTGSENNGEPSAMVSASIAVLYLSNAHEPEDEVKLELRKRSLSDGYSFVRDHINHLAGLTPMDRLVLPSIEVSTLA